MGHSLHVRAASSTEDVRVNGVTITRAAIAREAQHHPAPQPVAALKAAARALVVRELLLQEARRLGIEALPLADDGGRRETDEEALIRRLVEREIVTPKPDEAACRRYYENNRRAFRSPNIYEPAHILFAAAEGDRVAREKAGREAMAILAELRRRPQRFAELARAHSRCPSATEGGNLGQVTAGQTTPEFERALFAMEPGTICEAPVATRYGLHIIRLDRKIDGRDLPFELVATKIEDYLRDSVTRRASAQYVARLVSRAEITGIEIEGAVAHRVN